MSRRTLDCIRGLWWFKRAAFIFVMCLVFRQISLLSHESKMRLSSESDEPVRNSPLKEAGLESTVLNKDIIESFTSDYLDYDTVFSNSSDFEFPLLVFSTVGRLGNCLTSYATALTFAGRYNATIAVTEGVFKTIAKLLSPDHLTLPVVASSLIADAYDMGVLVNIQPDYINDDQVSHLLPTIKQAVYRYHSTHDQLLYELEGYPNRMKMMADHHGKIRQNFQVRKHLREKVSSFLQKIRATRGPETTFIGFHIRQGDYPKFMNSFFHCEMPSTAFYPKALNYYRSVIANPVFVICTDDKVSASKYFSDDKDIIFSDFREPEEDLALLTQCSHSIMTVGSFGFWGSYLAGGEVIYPLIQNCSRDPFMHPSTLGKIGYKNWMALNT